MTVQELMDISPWCTSIEVVIRQTGHGRWIQGYRVGKDAKLYPADLTAEVRELKGLKSYALNQVPLEPGEVIDVVRLGSGIPIKIICKDCHKLPAEIGSLEICDTVARHVPSLHGDKMTSLDYSLEINCYPDNYVPLVEVKEVHLNEQIEGQLSIEDLMLGGVIQ